MNLKNKTNQKILLMLVIISMMMPAVLLLSTPKQANAQVPKPCINANINPLAVAVTDPIVESATCNTSGDQDLSWWQQMIVLAERVAAHKFLNTLTTQTVNWINSGFHGSPLFVQNPSQFFDDIGKTEVKSLVDQVGYDSIGQPFGKQFALNLINQYKQTAQSNMQYSLSKVINDPVLLNNYRNNFSTGGWNGFLINTQYPQNNYLGYTMMQNETIAQRLMGNTSTQNTIQKAQTMLSQGNGFLSPTMCSSASKNADAYNKSMANEFNPPQFDASAWTKDHPWDPPAQYDVDAKGFITGVNPNYTTYKSNYEYSEEQAKAGETCLDANGKSALVVTTPGAVVANQITTAMGSSFGQSELGQAVGGSLAAILDALTSKFINSGLSALGGIGNSSSPVDTWSYNGNSLDGGINIVGSQALNIPTSVSIKAGSTTPGTTILGGITPYSIKTQPNSTIATAKVGSENGVLTVTGISVGQTSLAVQDSSSPIKTATVQITVTKNGTLAIDFNNPSALKNVSVDMSGTNIDLSGGIQPYHITTLSDSSIAMATASGDTLIIVGVSSGTTSLVLQDSSSSPKVVTLQITTGSESPISATPQSTSVSAGSASSITLSGGIPPFNATIPPNTSIATVSISGNTIYVVGLSAGTTLVTIQDSFTPAETITIPITVTGSSTLPIGTGTNGSF